MQTVSLIFGLLAFMGLFVGFFPCLGSLNWINIPMAGLGLILSLITLIVSKDKESKGAVIGLVLCGLAISVGIVRLVLGGGIL
ncbi:MAG: hypothetical protein KKE62_19665 [Proteobacteria bacterium]|nr:hypothetical protein [Pseudomonadota bacterium]MBU1389991.1 hypothetical protein [Pseudomonadota bacterium]MBU1545058.1 hypothetical protein [Pseudomonadota bacterium]MBU2480437.1 hypothetical protein [Pseudomonadota bacterium]